MEGNDRIAASYDAWPSIAANMDDVDVSTPLRVFISQQFNPDPPEQHRSLNEKLAMSDMTREEVDAKLQAVEARSEIRYVDLSGKLDRVLDALEAASQRSADLRAEISSRSTDLRTELGTRSAELGNRSADLRADINTRITDLRTEISTLKDDIKSDNKLTRWTVVGVVVASILAAVGALWTTQGNLLSAFQAGIALHSSSPAVVPPGKS